MDVDDLVTARDVAPMLGLSLASNVSVYRKRYDDFPEPVVERPGYAPLWLHGDIVAWQRKREERRRARARAVKESR